MQETWVRSLGQKIPWRRKWQSNPVFLPGKSQGQRNLVGYSPQICKKSDTTEATEYACTQQAGDQKCLTGGSRTANGSPCSSLLIPQLLPSTIFLSLSLLHPAFLDLCGVFFFFFPLERVFNENFSHIHGNNLIQFHPSVPTAKLCSPMDCSHTKYWPIWHQGCTAHLLLWCSLFELLIFFLCRC